MSAVELISLYRTLFFVSLGIALLGLVLAVFFFFFFDIRTVYAMMTGRAKEQTVRRMAEQNAKTGNLRKQHIHTGPTGETGQTKGSAKVEVLIQPEAPAASETVVLQPDTAGETVVLENSTADETAVLSAHSGFCFDLTETTLVIHTNEII